MIGLWPEVRVSKAADNQAATYAFQNAQGDLVEGSVDASSDELLVITASTQVGCRVACTFCSAGLKFVRSLRVGEIVAQIARMISDWRGERRPVLITFMGMGEPALNLQNLLPALRELHERYPQARLYVSTSGPNVNYDPLIALARELRVIDLQVSVHEPTDERRARLIPFKAKMTLCQIAELGRRWYGATGHQPVMNYSVHEGNASDADSELLAGCLDPHVWLAKVSVINASLEESATVAYDRGKTLALRFLLALQQRGFAGLIFDQFGQRQVAGACGQFQQFRDWVLRTRSGSASG